MSNENMKNSRIILGEASESDSETEVVEINTPNKSQPQKLTPETQPKDEESSIKKDLQIEPDAMRGNFNLLKKNISFRSKICTLTDRLIDGIQKELSTACKDILKSELTLQETITSLNVLRYNTRQLENKLSTTISCNYFPHIKTVPAFNSD